MNLINNKTSHLHLSGVQPALDMEEVSRAVAFKNAYQFSCLRRGSRSKATVNRGETFRYSRGVGPN